LLETLGHLPGLTARRQRAQRAGAGPVAGRCDGPGRPLLGDAGSRADRTRCSGVASPDRRSPAHSRRGCSASGEQRAR
jgi:hypothetical protein